jgi:hypothetical protein
VSKTGSSALSIRYDETELRNQGKAQVNLYLEKRITGSPESDRDVDSTRAMSASGWNHSKRRSMTAHVRAAELNLC